MRVIPNMSIVAPCDEVEMEMLVKDSIKLKSPLYIRIARGGEEIISSKKDNFKIGKGILKKKPGKILFISTGVMTQRTLKAAKKLEKELGLKCGVLHLATIKPLDKKILSFWIPKVEKIITVEENVLAGGFGSSILEFTSENFRNHVNKISRVGLSNKFINKYGSQDELCHDNGLTAKNLYNIAKKKSKI